MIQEQIYKVILLPRMEVAANCCSLREASAWMHSYNQVMHGDAIEAVVAQQPTGERPKHRAARRRHRQAK